MIRERNTRARDFLPCSMRLDYPTRKPAIRTVNDKEQVFCICRKRWMALTPEEWVRQNMLLYLTEKNGYPLSLIAVERQLILNELKKRFDIVVFKKDVPAMLIECKELNVPITEKTLEQALRYNINLQATYFVLTNGSACYVFKKTSEGITQPATFPLFTEL